MGGKENRQLRSQRFGTTCLNSSKKFWTRMSRTWVPADHDHHTFHERREARGSDGSVGHRCATYVRFASSAALFAPSTQFGMTHRNEAVLWLVPWT